eukprot:535298-Pleurochrysis_carterae.AAC.1
MKGVGAGTEALRSAEAPVIAPSPDQAILKCPESVPARAATSRPNQAKTHLNRALFIALLATCRIRRALPPTLSKIWSFSSLRTVFIRNIPGSVPFDLGRLHVRFRDLQGIEVALARAKPRAGRGLEGSWEDAAKVSTSCLLDCAGRCAQE